MLMAGKQEAQQPARWRSTGATQHTGMLSTSEASLPSMQVLLNCMHAGTAQVPRATDPW
jgi:hypothetical protein